MFEITALQPQAHSDSQLVEIWLHGRSPHTQRAYAADVSRFMSAAGQPLVSVTLAHLQNFADSLGNLAPASRYRILSDKIPAGLRPSHWIPALRRGPAAAAAGAPQPSGRPHRMLSLEPDERNRAILTLLYASGVRVSELCGLSWRDFQANGDAAQITVFGKGAKTRAI